MRNIVVVPYDKKWKDEFLKIKNELDIALKGTIISIEHVGSTSVEGLCAKPIIDIDIVIEENMFSTVKQLLKNIGYEHVGDLGIVGREAFDYNNKSHLMVHHLYVCNKDSAELKRHIALRDYLLNNKDDRDRYSNIKIEMAKLFPHDIDSYIKGKENVIIEIYKKCGLRT